MNTSERLSGHILASLFTVISRHSHGLLMPRSKSHAIFARKQTQDLCPVISSIHIKTPCSSKIEIPCLVPTPSNLASLVEPLECVPPPLSFGFLLLGDKES